MYDDLLYGFAKRGDVLDEVSVTLQRVAVDVPGVGRRFVSASGFIAGLPPGELGERAADLEELLETE